MEPTTTMYPFDLGREIAELRLRSQAGIVLVSAAALDGSLRNLLLLTMSLSNNKAEQIFGSPLGPLYHFSPKIDIAYAFKVIEEDLYNDLRIIKDIRNKFAHPEGPTDFETPKIKDLVRKFKAWTSTSDEYQLFIHRVEHCLSKLNEFTQKQQYVRALATENKAPVAACGRMPGILAATVEGERGRFMPARRPRPGCRRPCAPTSA